jgi:hypothetical protein
MTADNLFLELFTHMTGALSRLHLGNERGLSFATALQSNFLKHIN